MVQTKENIKTLKKFYLGTSILTVFVSCLFPQMIIFAVFFILFLMNTTIFALIFMLVCIDLSSRPIKEIIKDIIRKI